MSIIRNIVSSTLLLAVLFWTTKNVVLLSLYELDQKTFVALFCENKEKPELECNGHCQINQMTQDNESDHSSVLIPLMQAEIFLFLEAPFQLQTKDAEFVASEQAERGGIAENSYTFDFYTSQEKPPTTLVC